MVLTTLAGLGIKFSCQNKLEMEKLSKIGVTPQDIFFVSSVKVASHLRFANSFGVEVMAFETAAEIEKIKKNSPNARSVGRVASRHVASRHAILFQLFENELT